MKLLNILKYFYKIILIKRVIRNIIYQYWKKTFMIQVLPQSCLILLELEIETTHLEITLFG